MADLAARWVEFARRVGVRDEDATLFTTLADGHPAFPATGYNKPERHYHNLDHVQNCLNEFDRVRGSLETPDAVEAAIWFHDFVYDPDAKDNEEKSGGWAFTFLHHGNYQFAWIVVELINDTAHRKPPVTNDGRYLVDIDLSILGQPADVYDEYDRNIRREYAHVPEEAYRVGRAAVLNSFLARPEIYLTETFRARYERAARENLSRSLLRLGASSST
jgi:predicted metal-dependent HD superfamily phosphohydrolase